MSPKGERAVELSDLFYITETVPPEKLRYALLGSELDSVLAVASFSDLLPEEHQEKNYLGPPPWAIGLSKQFKKDTDALDRKIMGRLFEVLAELSDYVPPFKVQGDTFKPLGGVLQGCWRYRIGDNRLVIKPVAELARLDALAFAARGSVYD